MTTIDIYLIASVWFLFIVLFTKNKQSPHSAILMLYCIGNMVLIETDFIISLTFNEVTEFFIYYESITAILMLFILKKDRVAWKQALLLALASLLYLL